MRFFFTLFYLLSLALSAEPIESVKGTHSDNKQQLVVATDEWPPFRILHDDGSFSGFDIDLLNALSEISNVEFKMQRFPWSRALKKMRHNKDVVMTGLAYTAERASYINYVAFPYYTCSPAFYMQRALNADIYAYQELYQYKIGYVLESAYFEPFNSDEKIKRHGVVTEIQLLKMAERGRIDLFIGTDCQVDYEISKRNLWGKLKKVSYQPVQKVQLYLGLSSQGNNSKLSTKLGHALIELDKSGQLQAIKDKYFKPSRH